LWSTYFSFPSQFVNMPFIENFSISEQIAYRNRKMSVPATEEEVAARFEELTVIEAEAEDADLEIRK
jgi:hypothetical protein